MSPALLDTNIVSAMIHKNVLITQRVRKYPHPISISVISLGELHYGLERLPIGKRRTELEENATRVIAQLLFDPIDESIANEYAKLKAIMEQNGIPMSDHDLWIAATAKSNNQLLVTRDKALAQIPGITVSDWSQ